MQKIDLAGKTILIIGAAGLIGDNCHMICYSAIRSDFSGEKILTSLIIEIVREISYISLASLRVLFVQLKEYQR